MHFGINVFSGCTNYVVWSKILFVEVCFHSHMFYIDDIVTERKLKQITGK